MSGRERDEDILCRMRVVTTCILAFVYICFILVTAFLLPDAVVMGFLGCLISLGFWYVIAKSWDGGVILFASNKGLERHRSPLKFSITLGGAVVAWLLINLMIWETWSQSYRDAKANIKATKN